GQLIEVTNGRLQDDEEHGSSFEGRTIEFNLETGNPNRSKTTDRFYLDELAKKLTKKDYDEWVEIGRREAEALADAKNPPTETEPAKPATKKPAKTRKAKTDGIVAVVLSVVVLGPLILLHANGVSDFATRVLELLSHFGLLAFAFAMSGIGLRGENRANQTT
ncbi:MAG: hypothetical protein KDA66_17300, partial [Planctomycetaceae bacterium]|nr:hypothetical protein [Planctomycetaceae bacterium]